MQSIKELYRIGLGPSSSHTMGPKFAAEDFLQKTLDASWYRVSLYESLAATGKGHLTDKAIYDVLGAERTQILFKAEEKQPEHPNAMLFEALCEKDGKDIVLMQEMYFSVGGGEIRKREHFNIPLQHVYPATTLEQIMLQCDYNGTTYWEYVLEHEGEDIFYYLLKIWYQMLDTIGEGLNTHGVLPGSIRLRRQAWNYLQRTKTASEKFQQTGTLASYAFAVSEQNAAGKTVVTAPTCGACGVIPSVLKFLQESYAFDDSEIVRALATAAVFGNIAKHNASISGAEVGCQGEVGVACAMAAAAACQLFGGSLRQIECAAEMGLEHHLGLTCDPVDGLVQIPCIERNVSAAARAISCAELSILSDGSHLISFDEVVDVMMQTGKDLPGLYRETSLGGLAKIFAQKREEEKK